MSFALSPTPKTAVLPRSKHRICSYGENRMSGTVVKANTVAVKLHMAKMSNSKVRILSSCLDEIIEASPPSLLIEDESEDLLGRLEKRISALEQEKDASSKRLKSLEEDRNMLLLFIEDGQWFSIRAFVDKVLQLFYTEAGKGALTFEERSRWLFSTEAEAFVDRGGILTLLGDATMKIDRGMLKVMQKLRHISKSISKAACHTSNPIKEDYALEKLSNVDVVVYKMFESCFKVSPKSMIQRWEEKGSSLNPIFNVPFPRTRIVVVGNKWATP